MNYQSIIFGIFIVIETIYGKLILKSVKMDKFMDESMIATVIIDQKQSGFISEDLMKDYEFDKNAYLFKYNPGKKGMNFGIIKHNNDRNYDFIIKHESYNEARKFTKVDTLAFLSNIPSIGELTKFRECNYNVQEMKDVDSEKCAQQVSIYTVETDWENNDENNSEKALTVIIAPAMGDGVVADDLNEEVRLSFKEDRSALYRACKEKGDIKIMQPDDETAFVRTCQWILQTYSDVFRNEIKGINKDDTISSASSSWGVVSNKNGDHDGEASDSSKGTVDGEGKSMDDKRSDSILTIKGKIDIQYIEAGVQYLFTNELDDEYLVELFQFGYVYNVAALKITALNRITIKRDINELKKLLLLFNNSEYERQFIKDAGKFLEGFIKSKFKEIKESGFFVDLSTHLQLMIFMAKQD